MDNALPQELTEEQLLAMPAEEYMSPAQLGFFRRYLEQTRAETMERIEEAKQRIAEGTHWADDADAAAQEEENRQCLRLAEREARLLPKIDRALRRIEAGTYGYCEESGEPIGLRRLLLRPTAELSAEAKALREQVERHYHE